MTASNGVGFLAMMRVLFIKYPKRTLTGAV
ncbi:hypothetical protein ABIB56_001380 [Glaciihabitans sp. UYNi722]